VKGIYDGSKMLTFLNAHTNLHDFFLVYSKAVSRLAGKKSINTTVNFHQIYYSNVAHLKSTNRFSLLATAVGISAKDVTLAFYTVRAETDEVNGNVVLNA